MSCRLLARCRRPADGVEGEEDDEEEEEQDADGCCSSAACPPVMAAAAARGWSSRFPRAPLWLYFTLSGCPLSPEFLFFPSFFLVPRG